MEGNLTRARSSLHVTTPSRSSFGSDSTPSPPVKRASTATCTREHIPNSPTYSPGHSRVSSDNTTGLSPAPRIGAKRSASALGASGGYRRPLAFASREDHIKNSLDGHAGHRLSSHLREHHGLEPLSENGLLLNDQPGEDNLNTTKLNEFLSPTFGSFSDNGNGNGRPMQRSASVAQMRDLKEHMKDLKGKISSLREQARADSLKRRSLQSLRTPSPFTHAQVDQWYAEPKPSGLSSDIGSGDGSGGRNPSNGEGESVDNVEQVVANELSDHSGEDEDSVYSENENSTRLRPPGRRSPEGRHVETAPEAAIDAVEEEPDENNDAVSDVVMENDDFAGEIRMETELLDEEDYYSESGESLYHDTLQHPISHEDREDAFDYEHFFLHSAMGTISQQRLARRGSRDSYTSEDSVETTRGPIIDSCKDGPKINGSGDSAGSGITPSSSRRRRNSDASISTVGTFATANESSGGSISEEGRAREHAGHGVPSPTKSRPGSPASARNVAFASRTPSDNNDPAGRPSTIARQSIASFTSIPEEEGKENEDPYGGFNPPASVSRRHITGSATASLHRPSVSSFESIGTTRSFPLVNRPKKANSISVLSPQDSSPDHELKALSDSLLNEAASICEQQQQERDGTDLSGLKQNGIHRNVGSVSSSSPTKNSTPQALQSLNREDQYLVERLVANLGRCVLGLTESGKASAESRMYRRRIDAARRILEGLDQP